MTKAFDLALFVGVPVNIGDGPVIDVLGPPFTTKFAPLVQGTKPGVTVGASMPAAAKQNQIMVSGPGPNYLWGLADSPAIAAVVPPATSANQVLMSDAGLLWQTASISIVLAQGGAVTQNAGGVFAQGANLVFTPTVGGAVRIDGGDPALSRLDNFSWDAGTF